MQLDKATTLANAIKALLQPYCLNIEIVGSIRRRAPTVNDIDIILIPNPDSDLFLRGAIASLGAIQADGQKLKRLRLPQHNINVDIYIATSQTWPTLLLIRTGSKENNIYLCNLARQKGWHLHADGDGLFDHTGHRIADSEQSIYQALGVPYQEPHEREARHHS